MRTTKRWGLFSMLTLAALVLAPSAARAQHKKLVERKVVQATPPAGSQPVRARAQRPPARPPAGRPLTTLPSQRRRPPTVRPRRRSTIPKPTVVLKPGEVPAIKFDDPVYDFGRVQAGTDVLHDFVFHNTGTGPLEILKAKPG